MTFRTQMSWEGGPGIVFDSLISESPSFLSDVPSSPTEAGYVADTCTRRPLALRLEVAVTDNSLYTGTPMPGKVGRVRDQLLTLQSDGTLVRVLTETSDYPSMVLGSVTWTRDAGAGTQVFSLVLTETQIATTSTAQGKAAAAKARAQVAPEVDGKKDGAATKPPKAESDWSKKGFVQSALDVAQGSF